MKFVTYPQSDSFDCGPACLRMVMKHYGKDVSMQSTRILSQIGKTGVNLFGISEAAELLGFRTSAVRIDVESLMKEAVLPAIIFWNKNHFIVLYKIRDDKFFVADPMKGLVKYNKKEFLSYWGTEGTNKSMEGVTLLLEPGSDFFSHIDSGEKNKTPGIKNMVSYAKPYRKLFVQLLIGFLLSGILQLCIPFLTRSIVDNGINTKDIGFIYIILAAQTAMFLGRVVVEFIRSWVLLHISTRINLSILTEFLIKLMRLPLAFFDSKNTGDILQRMTDHLRIEAFLTGASINTIFSLFTFVIFSFLLMFINRDIFVVFLISTVLYTSWVKLFLKKRRRLDSKRFEIAGKEQGAKIQLIQGMQEIKLNGIETQMRWLWEHLQAKLYKISMRVLALTQWQQSGTMLIMEGKNILITFLSAKAVINSHMTFGTMLAIQYMIGQLNSPMEQMAAFLQSWQNAKLSMERLNEIHSLENEEPADKEYLHSLTGIFNERPVTHNDNMPECVPDELLDQPFQPENSKDQNIKGPFTNAIRFESVSFTYAGAGNTPVLKNIDFSIPIGKTTAIVGVSGSGKTTLLKLLLKFYEPQHGNIKLGNALLSQVSHKYWRKQCGVVMQESYIFSDTISKNITLEQDQIDLDRLNTAIKIAVLDDFLDSLPLGYNTKIGPEGVGISMGQRQRILIARSVYRNPGFIFFDEATNSLDANNESKIITNLNSFFIGKTVIIIAHRLSTVKNADQIIVLKNGQIVESGKHNELISRQQDYYTLVKNQLDLGN